MKSTLTWEAALATSLLASAVIAQNPLSGCQQPETTCVIAGQQYKTCTGSDYQGPTLLDYHNVASGQACAQQCQQYSGCTRAVYDTVGGTCHIKGPASGLTWVANGQGLETIRLDKQGPAPGTVLSSCPYDVQTYTSTQGWQYQVCPGTDYQGTTTYDQHGLNSDQDCANACASYNGCVKAVYDVLSGNTCHFKAASGVQLVANPNSDTITFLNRPGQTTMVTTTKAASTTTNQLTTTTIVVTTAPSTTTAALPTTTTQTSSSTTTAAATGLCPGGAAPDSIYTAFNGDIYGICKNTDFPGGDMQAPIYNVSTIQACADLCSGTVGCVAGNLHRTPQICYLKGVQTNAAVNSAVDGAYLIKAVGTNPKTCASTTTAVPATTGCQAATVTVTVTAKGY